MQAEKVADDGQILYIQYILYEHNPGEAFMFT